MGSFTGGELALHGRHRLEHKLVVLGRHGAGSRHLRAHGRNGLLRIADGKLLDQKRRQILGDRRFGNAPCQEARRTGLGHARRAHDGRRGSSGSICKVSSMLADTATHAGSVPLHRGEGVGMDQGQIGAGGAQRQQLALEPAPVHLRLGQAAAHRGRGNAMIGAAVGCGRFRIEDARRLEGRQLLQHVLLVRASAAGDLSSA